MAEIILIQIDDLERPATPAEVAHIDEVLSGAVPLTPFPPPTK